MSIMPTFDQLPISPCVAPWVRKRWLDRITVAPPPIECRIYGRELIGPCWLWHGATNGKGHGRVFITKDGKDYGHYLHRLSLASFHGIGPAALDHVDHLCRRRNCFQPLHVESVTPIENCERGDGKAHQFLNQVERLSEDDIEALIRGY